MIEPITEITEVVEVSETATSSNLELNEKVSEVSQLIPTIFDDPQTMKREAYSIFWPRMKNVLEFKCISNIAYASIRHRNLFKCFSSVCNFRSASIGKFDLHLILHDSQDVTLKKHNYCEIVKQKLKQQT